MPKKIKTDDHPVLVHMSKAEASELKRAAEACNMPRAQFIRESSLAHAAKCLAQVK